MSEVRARSAWWLAAAIAASGLLVVLAIVFVRDSEETLEPPDLRNGQIFIQDNLWTTDTEQYAVWVGRNGTPFVGKRRVGDDEWMVADLSTVPGNPLGAPTADDLHNVYVVAVDGAGFVHVIGNMHGDSLRYIRSTTPGDIEQWEPATMPGPVDAVTYPRLVGLPDGTLQFWHREGIAGDGDVVLHTLDVGSGEWQSIGTVIDGRATGESPYPHRIAVDPRSGTIHVLFEWRAGGDLDSNNDVGYLQSRDGGRSWLRSDGQPVTVPVNHETAEVVIDTEPSGSGLLNDGGLAVDAAGRPHTVVVFAPGRADHVWLDGSTWRRERIEPGLAGRPAVVATADGRVLALGSDGVGNLVVADLSSGERSRVTQVPRGWEASFDGQAAARFDRIETLVPDGDRPRVVTVTPP